MPRERRNDKEKNTKENSASSVISWFPGHMTKARRKIEASLKLVDAVCEVVDARVPQSSRNPELDKIIQRKPRIIVLNKCDMADPKKTEQWINYYKSQGITAIAADCKSGRGVNAFSGVVKGVFADKIKQWAEKGMIGRTIRVMVVGIPNVGKSSFINKLTKRTAAKAEDRPGVTRGNQWFTVDKTLDILDTPGVLWPKFEDPEVGEKLAFTGAVKDEVVDTEELASNLLYYLRDNYPQSIIERYKIDTDISDLKGYEILELVGKKRGMLIRGGETDTLRASATVLDEFRAAKLGRITLEGVPSDD